MLSALIFSRKKPPLSYSQWYYRGYTGTGLVHLILCCQLTSQPNALAQAEITSVSKFTPVSMYTGIQPEPFWEMLKQATWGSKRRWLYSSLAKLNNCWNWETKKEESSRSCCLPHPPPTGLHSLVFSWSVYKDFMMVSQFVNYAFPKPCWQNIYSKWPKLSSVIWKLSDISNHKINK